MKIILLKDSKKLGKEGDVVEVKDGYARNCLIPQGLALVVTEGSAKRLEEIKRVRAKVEDKKKQDFSKIKEKIEKISLTVSAEAKEDEELYGTINEAQILKLLQSEGVELEKDSLVLDEPIKKLGVYNLKVNIDAGIEATLRVWVVKK
ncbi:MAG: 50S ribosomal protein L9 [Candidatus Omnitrophica bacterium]|nr:50S ribosomal protein L9 [Candidatus Omnitrophota bacterium]